MKIRYRCPAAQGHPSPGHIVMGTGPRIRRAYRVLAVKRASSDLVALGCRVWSLTVEPMSATTGRAEIAAGHPHWGIKWDERRRGPMRLSRVAPADEGAVR